MPLPDRNDIIFDLVIEDVRRGLTGLSSIDSAAAMLEAPENAEELREPPLVEIPAPYLEDPAISSGFTFAAVPWVAVGVHTGPIATVGATGRRLVVRGITLAQSVQREDGGDGVRFHRQVDWLGVYQQLGVVGAKKRPSASEPNEPVDAP